MTRTGAGTPQGYQHAVMEDEMPRARTARRAKATAGFAVLCALAVVVGAEAAVLRQWHPGDRHTTGHHWWCGTRLGRWFQPLCRPHRPVGPAGGDHSLDRRRAAGRSPGKRSETALPGSAISIGRYDASGYA